MVLESWHYIALLGLVIAVFSLIMPKKANQSSQQQSFKDELDKIELSLGQFMENMEQQHDELVNVVSTSLNQLKEDNRIKTDKLAALEKKCEMLEDQIATLSHAYVALDTKYQFISQSSEKGADKPSIEKDVDLTKGTLLQNPNSIHSRYSEVFEMYESGKSIEYIAKKVGKNKGEIQLIIQLAKQEEKIKHG